MALYRSCPAVSQICALIIFPSTWIPRVANSTPMVDLDSRLNSLRVNRESKLLCVGCLSVRKKERVSVRRWKSSGLPFRHPSLQSKQLNSVGKENHSIIGLEREEEEEKRERRLGLEKKRWKKEKRRRVMIENLWRDSRIRRLCSFVRMVFWYQEMIKEMDVNGEDLWSGNSERSNKICWPLLFSGSPNRTVHFPSNSAKKLKPKKIKKFPEKSRQLFSLLFVFNGSFCRLWSGRRV